MKLLAMALIALALLPGITCAIGADDLVKAAPNITLGVAERALDAVQCTLDAGNSIDKLIVVDMSLGAKSRRLWAFDLKDPSKPKMILNDRVAHGAGSDRNADGIADQFSNTPNSHMTSLGLYKISERYRGKNGMSRRLDGLLARWNSNARNRAVVMHPSSYVNEGRVGRSQGCPAVNQKTMDALEAAGLSNAVLWIDGNNQDLAREVADCAAKKRMKLEIEREKLELPVMPYSEFAIAGFPVQTFGLLSAFADPVIIQETLPLDPPFPPIRVALLEMCSEQDEWSIDHWKQCGPEQIVPSLVLPISQSALQQRDGPGRNHHLFTRDVEAPWRS